MLAEYLTEVRSLVIEEIERILAERRYQRVLYDLMLDYPLRGGKALRPALCIATCRAFGGRLEDVLRTSAVLELYHNAFLIHDDVEDGSVRRRGKPTLHRAYGVPVAVNVGDAMLAVAMRPLLDNTRVLGLGKALRILDAVSRMALESAEGQAMELHWIRQNRWALSDADYWHLVYKKTCWYTFIAPICVGSLAAGTPPRLQGSLKKFATYLGVSFQIQDDVLNLEADESNYDKDLEGDLVEGKRTLVLLHAMRNAAKPEREHAKSILAKPSSEKSPDDMIFLRSLIRETKSVDYARIFAQRIAHKAASALDLLSDAGLHPSVHRDFLREMVSYVVSRAN